MLHHRIFAHTAPQLQSEEDQEQINVMDPSQMAHLMLTSSSFAAVMYPFANPAGV